MRTGSWALEDAAVPHRHRPVMVGGGPFTGCLLAFAAGAAAVIVSAWLWWPSR